MSFFVRNEAKAQEVVAEEDNEAEAQDAKAWWIHLLSLRKKEVPKTKQGDDTKPEGDLANEADDTKPEGDLANEGDGGKLTLTETVNVITAHLSIKEREMLFAVLKAYDKITPSMPVRSSLRELQHKSTEELLGIGRKNAIEIASRQKEVKKIIGECISTVESPDFKQLFRDKDKKMAMHTTKKRLVLEVLASARLFDELSDTMIICESRGLKW